ncbi:MAG: hypothetical protein HYT80_01060 [Euryarchaeota archaeon]|nr:hypothetical protein [Euryarchaeota archaeon]
MKARLGVSLSDALLLQRALTHGSVNQTGRPVVKTNRELAFLGDAVIELAIRDRVFKDRPDASLEKLSITSDKEVRNTRLAELARTISLEDYVEFGKGQGNAKDKDSVLATALEAVFGAIFFEKGFSAAADCVLRILRPAQT